MMEEDCLAPGNLDALFENNEQLCLTLEFSGLSTDKMYIIKKHSVSKSHGSILDEWSRFCFETELEAGDVKYLRDICVPGIDMEKTDAPSGYLRLSDVLEANEIMMIHIYPSN